MFMTALNNSQIEAYNASGGAQAANTDPAAAQDRFLKLFVAQLNNQDPLNPLDNAEMTSQMAQINTVTGIQQVNETLKSMATQFGAMQNMQGASLVGRQVVSQGNQLSLDGDVLRGSFVMGGDADAVRVDLLGAAGEILDSVDLGGKAAGMQSFEWAYGSMDPATVASMQVTATQGGQSVTVTPLSRQRVESVGMVEGSLRLRTESGSTVGYDSVLAFM
jgi:flagellar basal-body rod modification protein FlgD